MHQMNAIGFLFYNASPDCDTVVIMGAAILFFFFLNNTAE